MQDAPIALATITPGHSSAVMLLAIGLLVLVLAAFGYFVMRSFRESARREAVEVDLTLARAIDDLEAEKARLGAGFDPGPLVSFEFHTYAGFLVWHSETLHRFELPAEFALILLRRLHWHNLRRGALAHGALLIPFLSYANMVLQRRSIRKQVRESTQTH